jgi:hypothetical protein
MPQLGVCTPPAGGFLKRFAMHCTILLVATIVTTAAAKISSPVNVEILLLEPAPVDVLPIDPNLLFTNHVGSSSLGSAHDKPTQNYIPGQENIRQLRMNYIAPVHSLRLLVLKIFRARYELRTMVEKHLSSFSSITSTLFFFQRAVNYKTRFQKHRDITNDRLLANHLSDLESSDQN